MTDMTDMADERKSFEGLSVDGRTARGGLPGGPRGRGPRVRAGHVYRYSVAQFLVALVLLFVATPFIEAMAGRFWEAMALTVVLGSAVLAVGGRRRNMVFAVVLVIPALAGRWVDHFVPGLVPSAVIPLSAMLFVGFIAGNLLHFILTSRRVDSEVLCAGVAAYLTLAVTWAMAYTVLSDVAPGSFTVPAGAGVGAGAERGMHGLNALYFSVMTLATVGYGDIAPVTGVARMLAMMEAMTGVFYIALLISRLVSLYAKVGSKE